VSSIRSILWFHFHLSGSFLNFFLLNRWVNSQIYSGRSSRFVGSSSFPISCCSLFWLSIGCILQFLNNIFWCCVLQFLGHLVNYIVPIFQFISGLCLTNQSYSRNMSVLFISITAVSICYLCLLILTFSSTNLVTSPFLVPSALKTLNDLFVSSVLILSSFTNCLLITI